ncbi:hypothetical protein LCGC14_0770560 [marine sediment metagenome]|uniref:Uncharacterized protein n=1 Tax=marine sediment metagenome TaxID=412755 RepID=A0A0F9PYI4_9ZZZZ
MCRPEPTTLGDKESRLIEKIFYKKETTDQDIWNFKNLIEENLINKFLTDLNWVDIKLFEINKEVAIKKLIKKYEKMVK